MAPAVGRPADAAKARFERYVVPELEVLLRVARALTANPSDAEDLVQDTLLRAYRGIDGFDGRHPRAWLLTILRHAEVNRHRRRRPGLLRHPPGDMERVEAHGDPGPSAEALVVGPVFDAVVEDAVNHLPDIYRQVIELVDLAGLSYREAADMLQIPVGTVMSRLHRGRNRIRDRLAAAGLVPRTTP